MAWDQLAINKPHLAYLIIGGFTSLFMLVSLYVKEKLYIGEATVATICGVIFGPHAANLFNPRSWGNVDQITLECSRIVLVVQCFAIGVELPKSYMERHWRSVTFLLVPVMTFGWLITSLFIWWLVEPLTWLESLACAACVTATDPVLASSVVGKGKFAKRVPKHLRDLLSAESGCNDGMAFPFIYLSLYLIKYRPHASEVAYHWICLTILYECIWGAVFGFTIGYIGRHAIKLADRRGLIDRESFLVFYFVLALFCAGSGSLLGMDDLLIGFSAGVGFSNDGWFTQKTEESHVSNVIDLLLNLTYFVFLGAIIPWEQYNAPEFGLTPWRLTVIALLVIFFRRIPIMLALKPFVPDIKNWREALFAGHFGPIGVGAIFAAILARAELETDSTTPLAVLLPPGTENYLLVEVIWPITTFLVIASILVHGSSIAVFTLGKRINTLTLTMSYTQANEPSWMNRLPRLASTTRSMSKGRSFDSREGYGSEDDLPQYPPGTLPPVGVPGNFLRRQQEEDNPSNPNSRPSSVRPQMRRRKWDSGKGPGGPISPSAIAPQRSQPADQVDSNSDTLNEKGRASPDVKEDSEPDGLEVEEKVREAEDADRQRPHPEEPTVEAYQEGDQLIVEDEEGNVLSQDDVKGETPEQRKQHVLDDEKALAKETSGEHAKDKRHPHTKNEGEDIAHAVEDVVEHPNHTYQNLRKKLGHWNARGKKKDDGELPKPKPQEPRRGPAHAYQYGNTIIVEDEDGEVIKKYDMPALERKPALVDGPHVRRGLQRMGTWAGMGANSGKGAAEVSSAGEDAPKSKKGSKAPIVDDDDDRIRFTVNSGGRRMSKAEFINQIRSLDPKARCEVLEESDVHDDLKNQARREAREHHEERKSAQRQHQEQLPQQQKPGGESSRSSPESSTERNTGGAPQVKPLSSTVHPDDTENPDNDNHDLHLVDSAGQTVPLHNVGDTISKHSGGQPETAAARRRRLASQKSSSSPAPQQSSSSSTAQPRSSTTTITAQKQPTHSPTAPRSTAPAETGETNPERRRRLAALGGGAESDSDDDGGERKVAGNRRPVEEPILDESGEVVQGSHGGHGSASASRKTPGIRFADGLAQSVGRGESRAEGGRVQWGEDVRGRKGRG